MRHRKVSRRLGRTSSHRQAMLRNMVTSLFEHERLVTTEAKAKELRRLADRMVTLAKKGTLHARRQALAVIRDKAVVRRLFTEIRERYLDRNGGYTRIIKYGFRRGDGAPLVVIELVTESLSRKRRSRPKSQPSMAPKVSEPKVAEEPKTTASEASESGEVSDLETKGSLQTTEGSVRVGPESSVEATSEIKEAGEPKEASEKKDS